MPGPQGRPDVTVNRVNAPRVTTRPAIPKRMTSLSRYTDNPRFQCFSAEPGYGHFRFQGFGPATLECRHGRLFGENR